MSACSNDNIKGEIYPFKQTFFILDKSSKAKQYYMFQSSAQSNAVHSIQSHIHRATSIAIDSYLVDRKPLLQRLSLKDENIYQAERF